MRGVVWGLTFDDAVSKLEEIESDYKRYHAARLIRRIRSKYEYKLEYDNGDTWRAVSARESSRGTRCNVSYIDARISEEFINGVIKRCTTAGPYHAINYYYDYIECE